MNAAQALAFIADDAERALDSDDPAEWRAALTNVLRNAEHARLTLPAPVQIRHLAPAS